MTTAVLEKRIKTRHPVHSKMVAWLLTQFPPFPISGRGIYEHYKQVVETVMGVLEESKIAPMARRELEKFVTITSRVLEEYEQKEFPRKEASPEDVLQFLMEQRGLTQTDIASDLGGQPNVSSVLSGKRELNKDQIARLSRRFNVSPAVFFPGR